MIRNYSVAYSAPSFRQALDRHPFALSALFLGRVVVDFLNYLDFRPISECQLVLARLFGCFVVWVIFVYMRYQFLVGTRVRNKMSRYWWLDECTATHDHSEFDLPLVLVLNRLLDYFQASISSYIQYRLRGHALGWH